MEYIAMLGLTNSRYSVLMVEEGALRLRTEDDVVVMLKASIRPSGSILSLSFSPFAS